MTRSECLEAADQAINGRDYGSPGENFRLIATLWSAYLQGRSRIVAADVAVMMALLKIGRLAHNPHHADSWADIAGYSALGAEVATGPVYLEDLMEGGK